MATDIVKAEKFAILSTNSARRTEIMRENMGAMGVSQFDLDRAKIPSGGITKFEIPTLEGSDFVDSLVGVPIGMRDVRVYWEKGLEDGGGGTPPDCYSDDSVTGHGKPGGSCEKCPFAQFGSADKGKSQACSQRRMLFLMRPQATMPIVLSLPPTSLGNARKFFFRLASEEIPYFGAVIQVGLERTKNAGGIDYARATFRLAEKLNPETAAAFGKIKDDFATVLNRVAVEPE